MQTEAFIAAALLPGLTLSLAHWFPWGDLPGRQGRPLPRLVTYAVGVSTIVGYTSLLIWRYATTTTDALLLLWVVTVSAGAATLLAWAIRWALHQHAQARAGEIAISAAREAGNGRD